MLLKCRYLSQFSLADVSKNATSISKAIEKCPFMLHARRTLVSSVNSGSNEIVDRHESQSIERKSI